MGSKVLIADDDSLVRVAIEKILKLFGHEVVAVQSGKEVLAQVSEDFDVIILDINMPEMDGFAATRSLRNDPETKNIPVVLVTAKDQKADKAWGQMLGAKGYITKPYTDAQVLETIKSVF